MQKIVGDKMVICADINDLCQKANNSKIIQDLYFYKILEKVESSILVTV